MEKGIGWKKALLYWLVPVAVLFLLLETGARIHEIWAPPMQVDYGQGFDPGSRLFVPSDKDPGRMVTNPAKTVSFLKQEFPAKKPVRTLRIVALGESSVNYWQFELTQAAKRIQDRFKDRFDNVEVINCGGLSYGSHRLVPIAAEVMNYKPDVVLLYVGHNEFEEVQQLELANLDNLRTRRALGHSALFRFIRDEIAAMRIRHLRQDQQKRSLATSAPDAAKDWLHEFTPAEVDERMEKFRNNLSIIATICRDNGVPLVMGSIPSNLWKPLFPKEGMEHYRQVLDLFAKGEYDKGVALGREILKKSLRHQSSDLENNVLREVAQRFNVPFAEVEAAVIAAEPHHVPGETLFGDHCHLNAQGNEILGRQYEEQVVKLLK